MEKIIVPIEVTASMIPHCGSDYYYIRQIFNALVEHKEVLQSAEYKRLYDELLDCVFRLSGWNKNDRERGCYWLEFRAKYENSHDFMDKVSMETVDNFLQERRKYWE